MKFNQIINLKNFRGELDDTTYIDQEVEDCEQEDCMDYETQNVSRTDFEKGLEEEDFSGISLFFIILGVSVGATILIIILICILHRCWR